MSAGELDLRGEDFPKKERPEFQQKSIGASKMCPCFKIHAGFNRDGGNPKILQGDMCDTCVTCVCHSGTDPYGRLARPAKTMVSRDSKYLKEHVLVWVNHGEHVFFLLHCPKGVAATSRAYSEWMSFVWPGPSGQVFRSSAIFVFAGAGRPLA